MDNKERERELREALVAQAERFAAEAIALSDSIADEPEISAQEYKSSQKIVDVLRNHGIETEYPFHGFSTAFKGVINPEKEHRMCLLTEYDALRGLGHACGHCASGSASVLAALALNELRDQLDFGVDIIGTPDEEFLGDKAMMAEDG
ncbi:MAG: M20 family peptidase, partial [Firmicutes bacterium]|nr:M20 family peptidase [Bacillota bacterium]